MTDGKQNVAWELNFLNPYFTMKYTEKLKLKIQLCNMGNTFQLFDLLMLRL